ncbi:MAG: ATP-binding protein [Methanomassiliicoccaceae archaeon]|nr:ATP-binding protein [Methanomassiliicoccaceae archaeon]
MTQPIERRIYTEKIKGFFDKEQVKVITGIRRSGKSEILKLVRNDALKVTDDEHIIFINFEDAEFDDIVSYKELNRYVADRMKDDKRYFIFLDEIQRVDGWEKAVNSLRLKNTTIHITGSTSRLLSGELATLLAGRYVAFEVSTLSFEEFVRFRKECNITSDTGGNGSDELDAYITIGGFPTLSTNRYTLEQSRMVVADIQSSAVLKDVITRNNIKNVPLLNRIISFIYDNVGRQVSIRKMTDHMKSTGNGADHETVSSYVGYLEGGCIIKKVSRYDIKGKKLLESNDKYYLADHSLQYAVRDMKRTNLPGILENIVHNELVRRGYTVHVGKMNTKEIDFVAERVNGSEKIYVQVCTEFGSPETVDREFSPLISIKDNYPKYVVTLDRYWKEDIQGVRGIHLKDFLLKETF